MCGAIHRLSTAHPPLFDGIVSAVVEAVIFSFITNSGCCYCRYMLCLVLLFLSFRCSL